MRAAVPIRLSVLTKGCWQQTSSESPARQGSRTLEECTASLAWQTFKPTHKGLLGNPRKYRPAQKGISSQLTTRFEWELCSAAAECKQHTYGSLLNSSHPLRGGGCGGAEIRRSHGSQQVAFLCLGLILAKNQHLKHGSQGQEKIVLLPAAARPCQLLPGSGFPGGPSAPAFCVVFSVSHRINFSLPKARDGAKQAGEHFPANLRSPKA